MIGKPSPTGPLSKWWPFVTIPSTVSGSQTYHNSVRLWLPPGTQVADLEVDGSVKPSRTEPYHYRSTSM
ncbi:MAG: hypothetical protein EBT22_13250 [Chloroflexi bacterium]|nr:hypothetical protein [Chloroflexota bacterium]